MEKRTFIDFDGVILNTQEHISKEKELYPSLTWDEYLRMINWKNLIQKSSPINDSLYVLKTLNDIDNTYILTRVHSLEEASEKVLFLRNNNISIPIFITPTNIGKESIVLPNKGDLLIDDYIKNIRDWISYGGEGILFDNNNIHQDITDVERQKSLKFLIKR